MKKILSLLVVLVLAFGCTGALAATVTATGDVYLRTGPGLDYANVGVLEKGGVATFLGNTSIDTRGVAWYNVNYNGKSGWVSSRYSELNTWSWTYGYVTATGSVYVRSGPGLSYSELGAIKEGDSLEYMNASSVDDRGVTWYRVYYGTNDNAWVSSRYTKLNGTSSIVTATGNANVRSGPGTEYDSLTVMLYGDTAAYLGSSSTDSKGTAWYKVNYGGVTGWVSSKFSKLGSGTSPDPTPVPWTTGTLITTGSIWMRSGPGLSYETVQGIAEGKTMTYLNSSSVDSRGVTWYLASYNGKTGWVSSRYTKFK